jgi:hypothetical protein
VKVEKWKSGKVEKWKSGKVEKVKSRKYKKFSGKYNWMPRVVAAVRLTHHTAVVIR